MWHNVFNTMQAVIDSQRIIMAQQTDLLEIQRKRLKALEEHSELLRKKFDEAMVQTDKAIKVAEETVDVSKQHKEKVIKVLTDITEVPLLLDDPAEGLNVITGYAHRLLKGIQKEGE